MPGCTGPPANTCTLPSTRASVSPSFSSRVASGSSCTGRLMIMPSAPSLPCRTMRMTVRWKRGSGILGEAISSWPASEGGSAPGLCLGRAACSNDAGTSCARRARSKRRDQGEGTSHHRIFGRAEGISLAIEMPRTESVATLARLSTLRPTNVLLGERLSPPAAVSLLAEMNCNERNPHTGPRSETRQFTAIIEREDNGYVALCPELDIASQGDSIEEARANLQEALELFLEAASPDEVDQRFGKRGSDPSATGRDSEFRLGRGV